jgi:hypothetical protein
MQLRSRQREQDAEKDRPLTPHFIVSVARGPDVAKVRTLTEICGLRVQVEMYNAPIGPLQCKRYQRFGYTQRNCGYALRCVACGDAHPSGKCHPKAAAEVLTIVVAVSGKKQRRPLQSEHKLSAAEGMVFPLVCKHPSRLHLCQLLNRRHLVLAGTTLSKGVVLSKLTLLPLQHPPHPIWTDGPSGRLSARTAPVSPLVLRRRWRNPNHTATNILTRHPLVTVSHLLRG